MLCIGNFTEEQEQQIMFALKSHNPKRLEDASGQKLKYIVAAVSDSDTVAFLTQQILGQNKGVVVKVI